MLMLVNPKNNQGKLSMRNKLIIAAVVLVGLASVAYAAFAQILTINGTGTATGDWDVAITGITLADSAGATENAAPVYTGTSATFDVSLAYPGAYATYDVAIANTGNIDATLSSITDLAPINATAPTDLYYTLSGVAVSDSLVATTGTDTATVTVTWDAASTTNITAQSKVATIELNYVQTP